VNGKLRDNLLGDIEQGNPTLSATADALAAEIQRLSKFDEASAFSEELARRAADSQLWADWIEHTGRYLADFDPDLVGVIEVDLIARRDELRERATDRGWDTSWLQGASGTLIWRDVRQRAG
jgi:hypothetical protein